MKDSLFMLCFVSVFVSNEAFGLSKEMAALQCKSKFRVPYSDVEKIKNRQMPETKEGKCMMACILKKLKVISKDGKFQVKTVKGWIANKYKDDTKKLKRAYAKADACAEELPTLGEDECEYAVKILECSVRKKKVKIIFGSINLEDYVAIIFTNSLSVKKVFFQSKSVL